jgi:hypothetical protein
VRTGRSGLVGSSDAASSGPTSISANSGLVVGHRLRAAWESVAAERDDHRHA